MAFSEVIFTPKAQKELDNLDLSLKIRFLKNATKLLDIPPRRHMKFGLPYYVEEVTKQARFVYQIEEDTLYIVKCFKTHKEYERWYKSFK